MYEQAQLLFFYCETPLHAGSADSVSFVDLPIQREKHTGFPNVHGSGNKGAMRDMAEQAAGDKDERKKIETVFGPPPSGAQDQFAGSGILADSRLLLFPVRSYSGVFAWITSPLVLKRFTSDMRHATRPTPAIDPEKLAKLHSFGPDDNTPDDNTVWHGSNSRQLLNGSIILEDYSFNIEHKTEIDDLAKGLKCFLPPEFQDLLPGSLILVSDNTFSHFVRFSTEVVPRIKMDETGTVESGALWVEELLPESSLLYSLTAATKPKQKVDDIKDAKQVLDYLTGENGLLQGRTLQIGGDETVGRGLIWVSWPEDAGHSSDKEEGEQ